MKRFEIFYKICWLLVCFLFLQGNANAEKMDSVEIGLITCFPHEEVYSLYGHTALRYHNMRTGEDLVFNYGVFNYKAPYFVARFVMGQTDYELGIIPIEPFCKYYRDWGSEVIEQLLDLTNDEKARIAYALAINYRPENRVYRYNFFYDNCSTRPRDMVVNNLAGKVIYSPREDFTPSYKEMIHELIPHHPWAAFGNDLLLGAKADSKTNTAEQQLLPLNLMHDFDHAQIYSPDGNYRPLVKERRVLVKPGVQKIEKEFPLSPVTCAALLLIVLLAVLCYEWKKQKHLVWVDVLLMLPTGVIGVLLFIMFFSEHPTTSTNLQIFLFNPLTLFFIPGIVHQKKPTHYWLFLIVTIAIFFLGGLLQDYAEGTEILALCLLTRYCSRLITSRKPLTATT